MSACHPSSRSGIQLLARFFEHPFDPAPDPSAEAALERLGRHPGLFELLEALQRCDVYAAEFAQDFAGGDQVRLLPVCRRLRYVLNQPLRQAIELFAEAAELLADPSAARWERLAASLVGSPAGDDRLADLTAAGPHAEAVAGLALMAESLDPHFVYPTSSCRESNGTVLGAAEGRAVEASMSQRTHTSIRVVENVLSPADRTLCRIYRPLGRCVALVDSNVDASNGERLEAYFEASGIRLDKLVYRAMEVDKGIGTVERMLGDFKRLGISRNEPVLIVGGGVIADTGGLACALYHRHTPYVMLGTSIVSGIDAGPSPRTCCDGFGYKNLFGAYHAPMLTITDRSFFSGLRPGWLRHGVAEIIKMAVVKDEALFEDLEAAGPELVATRFATVGARPGSDIDRLSSRILGRAMRSYVEAEYGNLYETHQCRPHAYGHTWSPGFEIAAGLLHGHAVSVGMGLGAFLSHREGWIDEATLRRILGLIGQHQLSLWHDILLDEGVLWSAQRKMVEKRGGNLAAPLPRGAIGRCGYLNRVDRRTLSEAIDEYGKLCLEFERQGRGVEPHCRDVGLEDPSTVASPKPVSVLVPGA